MASKKKIRKWDHSYKSLLGKSIFNTYFSYLGLTTKFKNLKFDKNITCLPKIYKVFTAVILQTIGKYLEENMFLERTLRTNPAESRIENTPEGDNTE